MVIDDKLKWEGHIDHGRKRGIGAINLIKPYVPNNFPNQIYNALVKPYFHYCSLVWQNCKLDTQITADNWKFKSRNVLNKLNLQPLNEIRLSETLSMRKKFKCHCDKNIFDRILSATEQHFRMNLNGVFSFSPFFFVFEIFRFSKYARM